MTHGIDTGFLVALELDEHTEHLAARTLLSSLLANQDELAIAPQVLAEFIHIATDPRRFVKPLSNEDARKAGEAWWTARDVQL